MERKAEADRKTEADRKAEVERIWLPFVPWLLVATARLPQPRQWLGLQLVAGVVLDVVLRAKW